MDYKDRQLDEVKVFKDPVHRYVHVTDQVIWDLIATSEFQRLRRIKQLGTSYLTFHGAEHSRFNHSLGVYEIVRRMIDNFQRNGHPNWDREARLLSLCAALLHDLGHGPFSHSFENVFQLDHEQITQQILLNEDGEAHQILERIEQGFAKQVADVIEKKHDNQLVISLISSQIDADRMDYLQRDAYYTGVSYGHFDMERILRVMRPLEREVVIKSTGMHAVEDYIMSRYQMYWQVYFHPVTRSAEVILTKIFKRVKHLFKSNYPFSLQPTHFLSFFTGEISLHDYLQLDETIVHYYFQQWQYESDDILSDLCSRFVNRRLFKYIEFNLKDQNEHFAQLQELFNEIGIDPEYYLAIDKSSDLPYDLYESRDGERVPIQLQMPNDELRELSLESEIVDAISGKKRTDHKLYYPLDLLKESKHQDKVAEIQKILSHQQSISSL